MAGAREFVYRLLNDRHFREGEIKLLAWINLDLASDSRNIHYMAVRGWGGAYNVGLDMYLYMPLLRIIEVEVLSKLRKVGFNVPKFISTWNWFYHYRSFWNEAEVGQISGMVAINYRTAQSYGLNPGHPLDFVKYVNFENLYPQLIFVYCSLYTLANRESLGINWRKVLPRVWEHVPRGDRISIFSFCKVKGQVVVYDWGRRWWKPVGEVIDLSKYEILVEVYFLSSQYNPFTHMVIKTKDGVFEIKGLTAVFNHGFRYGVRAFIIDRQTGEIIYALNMGIGSWTAYDIDRPEKEILACVFRSSTIILFDVMDPRDQRLPTLNMYWWSPTTMPQVRIVINDFRTHYSPFHIGIMTHFDTGDPLEIIFVTLMSQLKY